MILPIFTPSIREAEAKRMSVSQSGLHTEYQTSQ